jgi:hypothetical protein
MSMDGYNVVCLLAFPILFALIKKAFYDEKVQKRWGIVIPAILFSLFMVVGYSFQMEDSYYLLFGDWDLGQTAKTAIQLMGYYNLFYVAIYYLYRALENEKIWRLNSNPDKFSSFIYSGKSWIKIFAIFMIVWLPYMIACYPGYIQGDTPDQLSQIFGMVGDSASYLNLLDESVTLNNHHPVLHTLLLGGCFRIGHFFGNDNMGIFIYTLIQYTLVCIALALGIAYLSKLKLPYWVRNSVLLFYLFVPIYVNFAVLTTKDVIYSVFLMWFMLFMLDLMLDRDVFYKNIKKMCCFFLILGGVRVYEAQWNICAFHIDAIYHIG